MSFERDLLERATTALERQEAAFERQEAAFERQAATLEGLARDMAEARAAAREGHRQLLERSQRSESHFIAAMSEIQQGLERNTQRLEDMGDQIRANTRAVLAVLDRLEPRAG